MTFKDGLRLDGLRRLARHSLRGREFQVRPAPSSVSAFPVVWWRSVGHAHTGYAVEAFVDESCSRRRDEIPSGAVPAMMGKSLRRAGVAPEGRRRACGLEGREGRKRRSRAGVAVVESFSTYVGAGRRKCRSGRGKVRSCTRSGVRWTAGSPSIPTSSARRWRGGIGGFGLGHILYARADAGRGPAGRGKSQHLPARCGFNEMPEVEVVNCSPQVGEAERRRRGARRAADRSGVSRMRWADSG